MANTRDPILKPIPILTLRPTQMTVGMREVKEKRKRWREHKSDKKRAELLGKHMIPVVLGPDEHHYVVDHHHLARALHDEGVEHVLVTVIGDLTMVERDGFWTVMDHKRWAYPYDAKGERRHYRDLPKSVSGLEDDPFRSLAGELRRVGGFAKDVTPFSEFLWADFSAPENLTQKRGGGFLQGDGECAGLCEKQGRGLSAGLVRARLDNGAMSTVCPTKRREEVAARSRPRRQASYAASVPFGRQWSGSQT
jgi:hypothetical protein